MNIFSKVTLRSLRMNRTRTVVTIIGISLACALITSISIFFYSLIGYTYDLSLAVSGSWHSVICLEDSENAQSIGKEDGVDKCGMAAILGTIVQDDRTESANEYYDLSFVKGDTEYFKSTSHVLSEGRLPVAENEAIVSSDLSEKYDIGKSYSVELTANDGTKQNVSFTVVGKYIQDNGQIIGYTAGMPEGDTYYCYLTFDDIKKTYEISDELYSKYQALSSSENSPILLFNGVTRADGSSMALIVCATIVFGLIAVGACSLIYNAFSISVSERTKLFGLLSSVGGTRRQLMRSVFFEAAYIGFVGIASGILLGIAAMQITISALSESISGVINPTLLDATKDLGLSFRMRISLFVLIASVIMTALIVFISAIRPSLRASKMTAMEALLQSKDIKLSRRKVKSYKLTYKLLGLEGMLAQKHMRRNRRKYRVTMFSLLSSVVLFVSVSSVCSYINRYSNLALGVQDYEVRVDFSGKAHDTDEIFAMIKGAEGVENVNRVTLAQVRVDGAENIDEDFSNVFMDRYGNSADKTFHFLFIVDDESFKSYLEENNLDVGLYTNPDKPVAIYSNEFTFMTDENKYKVTNVLKDDIDSLSIGMLYHPIMSEEVEVTDSPSDTEILMARTELGKCVEKFPVGANTYQKKHLCFLFCDSVAEKMFGKDMTELYDNYCNSVSYYIESSDADSTTGALVTLSEEKNLGLYITNVERAQEQERSVLFVCNVLCYGFIIIISLISLANVFNTISTGFRLRRREFAVLRSVGMTSRGLRKLACIESAVCGAKALIFGIPASAAVTYMFYLGLEISFELPFYMPVSSIITVLVSVFFVITATSLYSIAKLKKDNPIDAMRNENI